MTDRLELRYQRLLRAYPRSYRDRRGTEMITTMLDMAAAGRGGPTRGQALHLILCGLRQRFRLPARRPLAWVGAVLAAVVLGAFGATAGTWLGWQTAASIPSDGELRALNAAMTGMPAPAAVYRERSAMQGPGALVRADGISDYSAERVRAALTADGWRITSFREAQGAMLAGFDGDEEQLPVTNLTYTATRGGLKLDGNGWVVTGSAGHELTVRASYGTEVWPREAAAVRPLTVAGLIAGALAGWLVAAAFACWLRETGRSRRWVATVACAVAGATAAVPVYAQLRGAYQVMMYAKGSPYPYIVYSPSDEIATGTWTVVGLLAVAAALVAAWPRRLDG
ncbi:hypothetical protein GCM10010168_63140 [Actinoplanes ianthinogenes]|uniref:Uncharacterized protein n=1 Tax=Actinoplanes ianthinogenes TaxID=122358 RepID=A0ABM7LJL1_9ACTN|nr:hypothetical protein [Actinoplanes ianthinogenes]BCJ39438.1 hypothetical protein Aiant_00950 [Actinoplanes ianthinogenes]GGR36100.1 hypothetical protein GCM10010168_63140 [Actinoplanes ianthinogenes]